MVAITATSSASQSLQQTLLQSKVAQAKQEAERAENQAQDLRQQANEAEQDAQKSRANYLRTKQQADAAAQATYAAPSAAARSAVPEKTQEFLVRMYTAAADKFAASGNPLKSNPNSTPIKNYLGQATGRIVNVNA